MNSKIYSPKEGYNIIAPYYDQWIWQLFWKENEYKPFLKQWCETLPPNSNGLDIGTGSGNNLFCFLEKGYHVDGIDISDGMLEICKRKHAKYIENGLLKCYIQDVSEISWQDRTYDWIISNRVFSHIKDVKDTVSKISNIINFNGQIFISDVHPLHHYDFTNMTLGERKIEIETHKHKIEEIEQAFLDANFEKVSFREISRNGIVNGIVARQIPSLMRQDPNVPIFFYYIFKYKGRI